MHKKILSFFFIFCLLPTVLYGGDTIKCASTTSTQNSGLLDYLLPLFTKDTGIEVQVMAVDTDDALASGQKGEVDVVLVHAEEMEIKLAEEGYFIDRERVMYNDFVILGPKNDPAGIKGTEKVVGAFTKIRQAKSSFASRGDNSDINMRENRIWAGTGEMPGLMDEWYISVGQGMMETIRAAAEKKAYTISDRATWYTIENQEKLNLAILFEGDPSLFNQYGVMIVNPRNHPHIDYRSSMNFVIWLTSPEGQHAIAAFKDKLGNTLFTPNAGS
ncbi:MAG TPA: tungsten ABC transporter substrate-binding protein [Desulfobacterales bacterium]|nr:tungsten ABC transporter substrate-binding protein [Desulfobacterales bacterium]HIP38035.1 tungsten ABC transporter substrate-binding protein [Desulfocapsa sulfexigens]